jgi:hypothetical protein
MACHRVTAHMKPPFRGRYARSPDLGRRAGGCGSDYAALIRPTRRGRACSFRHGAAHGAQGLIARMRQPRDAPRLAAGAEEPADRVALHAVYAADPGHRRDGALGHTVLAQLIVDRPMVGAERPDLVDLRHDVGHAGVPIRRVDQEPVLVDGKGRCLGGLWVRTAA